MIGRIASPGCALLIAVLLPAVLANPLAGQVALEPPPGQQALGDLLFNVRHAIVMGDFPLATRYIKALLGRKPPGPDVLKAIESDKALRDLETGLGVLLSRAALSRDVEFTKAAAGLEAFIEAAYHQSHKDPAIINGQIDRLAKGLRPREDATRHLREMAPWSLPLMIDALWNAARAPVRPAVVVALSRMGRGAVEPLCAALEMAGQVPVKINVVEALAEIGYPHAIPYIQQVREQTNSDQLKTVCRLAVSALRGSPRAGFSGSAGEMFAQLGDDYYKDQPSLRPRMKTLTVPVWTYRRQVGVVSVEVPREIYNEVMAMRCLARGLKLDADQPDAVALWIAANIRKEAQLPKGAVDRTKRPKQPKAHYYAVAAGPGYLLRALARAVGDGDAPVALGLVRALNDVGFARSAGSQAGALGMALHFSDRAVRYEAALAIARAHARTRLPESEAVVPTLAQAVGQTGEKYALALLAKGDEQTKLVAQIKSAGYRVDAVETRKEMFEKARVVGLPNVDLVVVAFELPEGGLRGLVELRKDFRFRHASTLMAANGLDAAATAVKGMPTVEAIAYSAAAAEIKDKVRKIQARRGDTGMTPEEAKAYALRAAGALRDVALSAPPGMDFSLAIPALIRALADSRAELAVAAGDALSYADEANSQRALAQAALDAKLAPPRRIAMFKALADSVKRFGNKLADRQVQAIIKAAMEGADMAVRDAAAQALGALDLPSVKMDAVIIKAQGNL